MKVTPVLKVRNVTNKGEVIVDILFAAQADDGIIDEFSVGYAIVGLKRRDIYMDINFVKDYDSKDVTQMIFQRLKGLCEFMRKQRGYKYNKSILDSIPPAGK